MATSPKASQKSVNTRSKSSSKAATAPKKTTAQKSSKASLLPRRAKNIRLDSTKIEVLNQYTQRVQRLVFLFAMLSLIFLGMASYAYT